jgi:hypothetical protein
MGKSGMTPSDSATLFFETVLLLPPNYSVSLMTERDDDVST